MLGVLYEYSDYCTVYMCMETLYPATTERERKRDRRVGRLPAVFFSVLN